MLHLVLAAAVLSATPAPTGIQPRARGYAIEVSAAHGAATLKAGDHIDVIAVLTDPESKQLQSTMILQNVIVLSRETPQGQAPHVVLLLIPEETELLALARATGALTFVARNPTDLDVLEERKPFTVKALLAP
ncbi:MAG: RcpC/CpaB family pilus assembly protein [Myxococcaceae bacterium]